MFTVSAKTKQPFDLSRSLCSQFLLETVLKPEVWIRYYYELFFQDGMVRLAVLKSPAREVSFSPTDRIIGTNYYKAKFSNAVRLPGLFKKYSSYGWSILFTWKVR